MLDLFNIPKQCFVNKTIPLEKFFDKGSNVGAAVKSVKWSASIKPELTSIKPINEQNIRYEEIQVICIELSDTNHLFDIVKRICKQIKYPCFMDIKYKEKFLISTCRFNAGKIDHNENIGCRVNFSHWIHPGLLSSGAEQMISEINNALGMQSDLYSIYTEIAHAVIKFQLSGTSRAHVDRLLYDMLGSSYRANRDVIMKYCTPYKKHAPTNDSIIAKYDKTKRYSTFTYVYDYEDIWYCFLKYEPTRKVIQGRRYYDIQRLIYRIDIKYEEGDGDW